MVSNECQTHSKRKGRRKEEARVKEEGKKTNVNVHDIALGRLKSWQQKELQTNLKEFLVHFLNAMVWVNQLCNNF